MKTLVRTALVLMFAAHSISAAAQQTTGGISGRVVDEQGRAVPGVTVTAVSRDTGFERTVASDEEGLYRLLALPVGRYSLTLELSGFTRVEHEDVVVNVAQATTVDATLRIAQIAETVRVTGVVPMVSRSSSGVGQVVDISSIENLPLNGRQFANLAATVPGVGLGFHSDGTKSTQYAPQISGGNGRNVNYVVDGGDNNDDTVGGLLQLFPLESIQEFNVMTQRFKAEYGRSNGGVLNVVTRSGTNRLRGSWFTLLRNDALNARTFSEQLGNVQKQPYRRYQFGASVGGPLVQDRLHYFGAFERIQQDTKQPVNTLGLFPALDGVYETPYRETMFVGKVTAVLSGAQHLAVRYGINRNSQPNNAGPRTLPESWSTSENQFNSVNLNHSWVLGAGVNEVVVQFADFTNEVPASKPGPALLFPNGVRAGANPVAPQSTEQQKWQFRNDLSRSVTGFGGLGHDLKAGVNWIHEPRLFISTASLFDGQYTLAANSLNAPVRDVMVIGGNVAVNFPNEQFGLYAQDDWRVTDRLTLNLGVRWDYVDGLPLDQQRNPNFRVLQDAGRAGRFAGTPLEVFGQEPRTDRDNIQPRLGVVYDLSGQGRDIVRGGWGIYTDFGYTNSNMLTAGIDAQGGAGIIFNATDPTGLRKADGAFFTINDPLSSIAALNLVNPNLRPLAGQVVSPRLEQPYTRQTNLGYSRELGARTTLSADYVRVEGRDLNVRYRPNVLVNGRRALSDLPIQPNSLQFRTAINAGQSQYDALILALRQRMSRGVDLNAWYTLSSSTSNVGPSYDDLDANLVQDIRDPFGAAQDGPSARSDARHRVTVSAIVQVPGGLQVAPFFTYRSALPIHTIEGLDLNADGNLVDRTARAYRYTGLNDNGTATFEETGPCETVNCSRRAPFSQLNLRVSRSFTITGRARFEAIAEVFNLFNATNPVLPLTTIRRSATNPALASFMQPTAFAGDFQQTEQRVGQLGIRVSF